MSELKPIARPYARAIFNLANETNSILEWSQFLSGLSLIVEDKTINNALVNKAIDSKTKESWFVDAIGSSISPEQKVFISLLANNQRLTLLPQIEILYQDMVNKHNQSEEINLYSAFPLDESMVNFIKEKISNKLNKKEVTITQHQDKSLIGGLYIQGKEWVIDASIKGQIKTLARSLTI